MGDLRPNGGDLRPKWGDLRPKVGDVRPKGVGVVACRLALPPELSHVHDVFLVSMLDKCKPIPEAIMQWYDVPIQYDATYEEAPVQILDRKLKSLRHREIQLVKVTWQHHGVEDATWELEITMQEWYPHLFSL
ncbi:uncharacterized protein LOC112090437 [Morus notabilis]|uniref:uncharacterized protein LOC112090437 n=1 Tax=Morus notabilis TaxID=981085 RepID=UPI000CED19E7|nr:uncharacterized protein LOC112090437 [Morus notabilis]